MADEKEAWNRIIRGDADTFNAFYLENAPRLHSFLRQILRDHQTAEDVAQESFTQLWQRPNGFDPERGTLRTYLFGIGRKRAADWWRRQRSTAPIDVDRPSINHTETRSAVGDAFHRLPEEQRTLLWLREVEGQSYAELSATLGIPIGTVRSRLFTAREALRKIWHGKP